MISFQSKNRDNLPNLFNNKLIKKKKESNIADKRIHLSLSRDSCRKVCKVRCDIFFLFSFFLSSLFVLLKIITDVAILLKISRCRRETSTMYVRENVCCQWQREKRRKSFLSNSRLDYVMIVVRTTAQLDDDRSYTTKLVERPCTLTTGGHARARFYKREFTHASRRSECVSYFLIWLDRETFTRIGTPLTTVQSWTDNFTEVCPLTTWETDVFLSRLTN